MVIFSPEAMDDVRDLVEATQEYEGDAWGRDVLAPWLVDNQPVIQALHRFGEPDTASVPADQDDTWALYALSRVVELLILPHQPGSAGEGCPEAYAEFVSAIGGDTPTAAEFHPFLHEIVEVQAAEDPATPPSIVREWWPPCLVGSMLLQRGGVTVRAGSDHLNPQVAASSALYWAWTRGYRKVVDLSHGWGSNSQWRTSFRRDYRLADRLVYNVDALLTPSTRPEFPDEPPVDIELVRHRCSTLVDYGEEIWVFDQGHREPR